MKVYPIRSQEKRNKIEMLLKASNKRNYLLWILGTNTGFRISDIINLKVRDVKGTSITVIEKKTNKKRTIKINKKLKAVIKDYIKNLKDNDVLFSSRIGVNKPISIRRVQQIVKKIAKLVGVEENINSHSMRKTFALNLYNASNKNIGLVMEALNHSSEKITLKYLCLLDELLDNSLDLIANM